MKKRVVFMGSPDFALHTLNVLHRVYNVVGVVTQPDRPAGRGQTLQSSDVKILTHKLGLPIIQPKSLKDATAKHQLELWSPDAIVVAAFGQILREDILNLPPYGCVNVHASLLPRWRGAAPVQAAILHDDVTGVTIMKMNEGLDTGPILSQRVVPIKDKMTAGDLFAELSKMGADLLIDTLPKFFNGEILPKPQDEEKATYAPRLKKADGKLDFQNPADFLARLIRAYNPWPGAFHFYDSYRLKVFAGHAQERENTIPGKRYSVDDKPAWGTIDGLLVLDEVQIAGKKRVPGEVFLHGAKGWITT